MILSNLDIICRRWLLEKSLPIHYYTEALFHASTAVRELSFDTLQIINSANLAVSDYGAVDLPDDFVDDLSVCIPMGEVLSPLPKQDWITPLRIHDTTTGLFTSSVNQSSDSNQPNLFYGFPAQWNYYWNVNDIGEPTGRKFGAKGGTKQGYKVVKERRQIQLGNSFAGSSIILLYISDGQSANNASQIEVLAISTIHSFIDWKISPNRAVKNSQEAATFYNEKRLLKARLNPLTKTDILNTVREGYSAGIKF